ncbi:hypothetical protein RHSIM_Rhsim05G0196000 [Rhododendron simsii]|uniref:BHLH domain-containing protein n=1 Tax=Rhododendron simsii TaxID=118357 RepID=A0A834GYK0_RHOSS|nr:hypothetical protein RHSIM_Rhsim05G0196000 [Rhododendron simsii]
MGASPLSQFLLSLCQSSHWNYAVFWKVQHTNEMLLTWEDGCYDDPKLRGSTDSILDYMFFNESNKILSSGCGSCVNDGIAGEYSIGQVVADLAGVHYRLGEGIVGEVAYTGNHGWVLCEDIFSCEFESKVVPQFPYEWLGQFAAGIKTVVLIPVGPHGVLQLGALEKVAEDQALVACIKDKFNAYMIGTNFMEVRAQTSWPLTPTPLENLDELLPVTVNHMIYDDPKPAYGVKSTNNKLPTNNQTMPVCLVQDPFHISGEESLDIVNFMEENQFCFQSVDLTEVSKSLHQSLHDIELEMMEGSMVGFPTLEDDLQAFLYSDIYNTSMNSLFDGDLVEQTFEDKDADNRGHEIVKTFFSFPTDCELHTALGPGLLEQEAKEYLWDPSLVNENACYSSSKILNRDLSHGVEPSTGWFAKKEVAEHGSEAVVPDMHSLLNDELSNNSNDTKFSVTSLGQFAASKKAEIPSKEGAFVEEKRVPWSSKTIACGARARNAVIESPPTSFESMVSTLTEEEQQKKGYGCMQTRKGSNLSHAGKKRAKPGENKKPRPRDRQLIQDRVKELRELVPNGSKCSIDGLLDNTIKHMLFLRSVSDQADKLKHSVHQAVTGRKNVKSSDTKCNSQSGTSWAFELGSDVQVCPIVVEDLENPGQMLIEMLCDDHGLFLEIAEVIRRFDLTILKGAMESRGSNTWGHFVVEASMGFHRLDIFWPLMQLLQRTQSPISSKI